MITKTTDLHSYEDLVEYADANKVDRVYLGNTHFVKLITSFPPDLFLKVVLRDRHDNVFISVGRMKVRPEPVMGFALFTPPVFLTGHRSGQYDEPFCGHCGARKK